MRIKLIHLCLLFFITSSIYIAYGEAVTLPIGISKLEYDFPIERIINDQYDFKVWYEKESSASDLKALQMFKRVEEQYLETIQKKVCEAKEIFNITGNKIVQDCHYEDVKVQKTRHNWIPFSPMGMKIKSFELVSNTGVCLTGFCEAIIKIKDSKGNEEFIKIVGEKHGRIGNNNVDWKIDLFGTRPDWAWWNSSFSKCKNITMTSPEPKLNEPVSINITGLTANVTKELRLVDEGCNDGGNLQNFKIIETDGSTYAFIMFPYTNPSSGSDVWSVYYDYDGIDEDESLWVVNNDDLWTRAYNGTLLPNADGWGDQTGSSTPVIVSDKGFNRLKMIDSEAGAGSTYDIAWSPTANLNTVEMAVRILGTSDGGGGEILTYAKANGEYISLDGNSTHLFHSTGRCGSFAGAVQPNDTYAVLRAVHRAGNTSIYINNVLVGSCDASDTTSGNINFGSMSSARTSQYLLSYYTYSQANDSLPILPVVGSEQSEPSPADAVPQWFTNASSIVTNYDPSTNSQFNVTWSDDTALSVIFIESNYTGTPTNYTPTNYSNVYSYSDVLPAGTHYWLSYANDSVDGQNSTDTWAFTVSKSDTLTSLWLNDTAGNIYLLNNSVLNTTVSLNVTETVNLLSNYTNWVTQSDTTPLFNYSTITSNTNGTVFNFTGYFTANDNYTASSIVRYVTVHNVTTTTTTTTTTLLVVSGSCSAGQYLNQTCGGDGFRFILTCDRYNKTGTLTYDWDWENMTYCKYGCYNATCLTSQTVEKNRCSENQTICGGIDSRFVIPCNDTDSDGFYEWDYRTEYWIRCNGTCINGKCVDMPVGSERGECTENTSWCWNNHVIYCRDVNRDDIYEWDYTNYTHCEYGCIPEIIDGKYNATCSVSLPEGARSFRGYVDMLGAFYRSGFTEQSTRFTLLFILSTIMSVGMVGMTSDIRIGLGTFVGVFFVGIFTGAVPYYFALVLLGFGGLLIWKTTQKE